jgi:outer membrane lipoprotein LolB
MKIFRHISLMISLLTLAACQTISTSNDQNAGVKLSPKKQSVFSERQKDRDAIAHWGLSGSFSYNDTQEVATGKISWKSDIQESPEQKGVDLLIDKIDLLGPFGAGAATLHIDSSIGAAFVAGRKKQFGEDARTLLFDVVGWSLPIEELRYWVYGLPSPKHKGSYLLDEKGNLKSLKQSKWQIRFSDYQTIDGAQSSIQSYPKKIVAENKGRYIKIKLVTKQLELK